MKNINSIFQFFKSRIFHKNFSLAVTFAITFRCHRQCGYCHIRNCAGEEMSTEQILSMIDEFSDMGVRRFGLTGGEPLLREDIGEVIPYIKNKGIFVTLFTTGYEFIEKKGLRELDALIISLDGPIDRHEMIRGSAAYSEAINAIRSSRSNGISVWTNTVLHRYNLKSVDFILEKANEFGFRTMFQPVFGHYYSDEEDIEKLRPPLEDYQKTINKLIDHKRHGAPILNSFSYLRYIMNPDWNTNKRKCYAGTLYCAVSPDGKVLPCPVLFGKSTDLNGKELGFKKAFRSLTRLPCKGCFCISTVESDFLFSLKPDVVYNTLRNFIHKS